MSPRAAFASVQRGIAAARDGDSILVYPGINTGEINFGGKAVTLQSIGDVVAFSGGAIACLERRDPGVWQVSWMITPEILT